MTEFKRMSRQGLPAKGTLFDDVDEREITEQKQATLIEPDEDQKDPISELKQYFSENLPFLTDHERVEIMEKYLDRDLRSLQSVKHTEAKQFLSQTEKEGFRDDLLDKLGYQNMFPSKVQGATSMERKPSGSSFVLETPEDYYDKIIEGGGIYIPKESDTAHDISSDYYTEWSEGLSHGKKTALGSRDKTNSKTFDSWADQFGLKMEELRKKLEKAKPKKDRKSEEAKEKELQERMKEHYQRKEALEDIDEPQKTVEIDWQVSKDDPGKEVQKIYEKLIKNETGSTRSEIMKEAWRNWYQQTGAERPNVEDESIIEESTTEVPFKKDTDEDFWGKQFCEVEPKEVGASQEKINQLSDLLSKAVSHAHKIHGNTTDDWGTALKQSYEKYGLLEPMQWVSRRAHELARETDKNYSESYTKAYKEWIFQGD